MRKRIVSFVLGLSVLGVSANAVTLSDLITSRNGNNINFSGKIAGTENPVMVKVFNSTYFGSEDKDGFVKLTTLTPDKNGGFSFDVVIPELLKNGQKSTGEYIVIYADGIDNKTQTFSYSNEEDSLAVYNLLKNFSADEFYTNFETEDFIKKAKSVGIDTDTYSQLSNEQKSKVFVILPADSTDINELADDLNRCINIEYITSCSEHDRILCAKKMNLFYNGITFEILTDDEKKTVADFMSVQNYSKSDDADTAFSKAVSAMMVKNARKDELTNIFTQNATAIGLSTNVKYHNYLALPETTKIQINERIAVALSGIDKISSTDEIVSLFTSSYDAVVNQPVLNGGGNGGSGGGSTSSGGGKQGSMLPAGVDAGFVPEQIKPFADISDAEWAREAIEYCTQKKIVSGYGDKTFKPNNVITREEFVTMLLRGAGLFEAGHKTKFSDVVNDSWYEPYVGCASKLGIINGISADKFGTGLTLTRQDMAVIVMNALSSKTVEVKRDFKEFKDFYLIADYAKESVKNLYMYGFINGTSEETFSGDTFVTRAQAVKVIYDAFCKE